MAGSDAQAGFYYQNVVAAFHVLEMLTPGSSIRSISLENPGRAKFVDDIIIDGDDKTVFLQIKWAEDESAALTLHNLVATGEGSEASLIQKLALGFQQIRAEAGRKEILLYSTRKAGKNKQSTKGFPKSLENFLFEFHAPFIASSAPADILKSPRYSEYSEILDQLKCASGIADVQEFSDFLWLLRFQLGEPDIAHIESKVCAKLRVLGVEQTQYGTLLDQVVKWSIQRTIVKVSDVLQCLGLSEHFTDPVSHVFPVESRHWVRTPTVFRALDLAIRSLKSGFILLEGEPGIGKSSLLASYKAQRKHVTFAYHCYVPDDRSLGNDRLERTAFVRSMCISLSKTFPDIELPHPYKEYSLEVLNQWIRHISQQNKRAVFIIDGLDHVHNKHRQNLIVEPLTAILDGLPPENVIIILSSQYSDALPQSLQDHIASDSRRHIKVPRFALAQIKSFLSLRGVELNAEALDLAKTVSGGVPVYLEYLATSLSDLSEYERERFLKDQPILRDETIQKYHRHLWSNLQTDPVAIYTLAVMAVRDDFTTPDDLLDLLRRLGMSPTPLSVETILRSVGHVLRSAQGRAVAISHNSFREFILENTTALAADINEKLMDWYESNPTLDEAFRHRFRHLFQLRKYTELLNQCNFEWMANSWMAHRPILEINQNIDLAWRAAAVTQDLTSFIRIALLKQRLALINQNLDLSTEEVACFLLDLGLTAEALRTVWDGERPLCPPVGFATFCLHHQKRLGRSAPALVMQAALADRPVTALLGDLARYYRACALMRPALDLFREISELSWIIKSEYKHSQQPVSDSARDSTNLNLQLDVVRELCNSKNVRELNEIQHAAAQLPPEIVAFTHASYVLVLARVGELEESKNSYATISFIAIPEPQRRLILLELADYGIWHRNNFREANAPSLPKGFVEESSFQRIEQEFFQLYDRFRFHFLGIKEAKAWLDTVLTGLTEPSRSVIYALGKLALVWARWVRNGSKPISALAEFQEILSALDFRPELFRNVPHASHVAKSLYEQESPRLFGHVWTAATQTLTDADLLALAQWWEISDQGLHATRNAAATRDFSVALIDHLKSSSEQIAHRLLTLAERSARENKETTVLVSEIISTARAWGRCGFAVEVTRLWRELLDIACGIGWRKDYQFNEILEPLALAHENNPAATRQRIADQLFLAHRLEGAARSKTAQVAIEDLIVFSSRISFGLSMKMLRREDNSIYRERAILSLVEEYVKDIETPLNWLWALVSSMARWDNYAEYNDYTRPARETIFAAAIHRREFLVAELIYREAKRFFLIEKDSPEQLAKWAKLWIDAGDAPEEVVSDFRTFSVENPSDGATEGPNDRLFSPSPTVFNDAVVSGIAALNSLLDKQASEQVMDTCRRELQQIFPEWGENLSKHIGRELTENEKVDLDRILEQLLQKLQSMELSSRIGTKDALRSLIEESYEIIAGQFGQSSVAKSLADSFNITGWLDRLPVSFGPRAPHQNVLEKLVPNWITTASLNELDAWIDFCRTRLTDTCRANGLLLIAKRVRAFDAERAKNLLLEAWQSDSSLFFEYRTLSNDIFSELFSLDPASGCDLLLKAFILQHQRFPQMIVLRLERVLKFAHQFSGVDFNEIYTLWADYNRDLTAGLSFDPLNLDWVTDGTEATFRQEILNYLIWLLEYPVIDVRLLSLRALYCLIKSADLTTYTLLGEWNRLAFVQKELIAVLLFAVGLSDVQQDSKWRESLVALVSHEPHFNLRRTTSEAVTATINSGRAIAPALQDEAKNLTATPKFVHPLGPCLSTVQQIPAFGYPKWMITQLAAAVSTNEFIPRVHSLLTKQFPVPSKGLAEEIQTHRDHNINDNFDALEISGKYDGAICESINTVLYELRQAHIFDTHDADTIADLVRVVDPTDILQDVTMRPKFIQWIDNGQNDADFLSFRDWEFLKRALLQRNSSWHTVFEHAEQRGDKEQTRNNPRSTRVKVLLVGTTGSQIVPTEDDINEAALEFRNQYRFELPYVQVSHTKLSHSPVIPIVQSSTQAFRGRHRLDIATLRPEFAVELNLQPQGHDWLGNSLDGSAVVRSTSWQDAFDQNRRRHEPRSSGFLLEASAEILSALKKSHGFTYWIRLEIKRSTDNYKSESLFTWSRRSDIFRLSED